MNKFDMYITLIFIVKICFICLAVYRAYLKFKKPTDKKLLEDVEFLKSRFEFLFVTLMSFLLIYLFNPRSNKVIMIDGETKLLLYLFGFVLLITENIEKFISESPLLKRLRN